METKVLQPAHEMTTAQCVMECSGYLRTIANQEFEGEDWQTAPKLRRQNLLTDFLCNLELSGKEFAELCGFIGFQLSKTTTAKLAKFTVIAYDWQSEANGEATADILAALDKCAGVTLIEEHGYRPQARTYDYLRFHIAAFWRCLVNELRSLCLGIGLVVEPKEMPATSTEIPQISTETAETVNVSAEGENAAETQEMPQIFNCEWQTVEHFKAIPNIAKLAKAGIIINGVAWHTEYLDQAHNVLARVDNLGWDRKMHIFPYQGSGVFGKTKLFKNWEDAVIATIDALTDYLKAQLQTEPRGAKYRISRLGGYKIIVGDRVQGKVIAMLMAVNGHNVIEINDEAAPIATMGEKPLQIDKPIIQLSDAEVLELIYSYTEPPQSLETPQTIECTAEPCKLAQTT